MTITFACECCKRQLTIDAPTLEEAKGDAMRQGWKVDILHDVRRVGAEPKVRALCDNPKCDYPK